MQSHVHSNDHKINNLFLRVNFAYVTASRIIYLEERYFCLDSIFVQPRTLYAVANA